MSFKSEKPIQVRRQAIETRLQAGREPLVQELVADLAHPDKARVADAAEAFAWVRDERAVPQLINLLGDSEEWVRDRAGFALARMWKTALQGMQEAIPAASPVAFEHLVRTYVRIGLPALSDLIQMLGEGPGPRQKLAHKALCQIAFPPAELKPLLADSTDRTRSLVIDILGKSRKAESIALLLALPETVGRRSTHKLGVALGRLARHFPEKFHTEIESHPNPLKIKRLVDALQRAGDQS